MTPLQEVKQLMKEFNPAPSLGFTKFAKKATLYFIQRMLDIPHSKKEHEYWEKCKKIAEDIK